MISIVTPTKNAATVLERNLSVMAKQQAQYEHIVQDGGSTDGTLELVQRYAPGYNLRIYQEEDTGMYDAISKGICKSTGDILGWLGADDYYLPWTLGTVESIFRQHPAVDWIIGLPAFGYDDGRIVKVNPLAPIYQQNCIRLGWHCAGRLGFLQQEAMFWRRSLWDKANAAGVISAYKYAGDYHLWRAFAEHAELYTVSSVLAVFNHSPSQISARLRSAYLEEVGHHSSHMEAAWWGKLFNRTLSILANHRVLRPELGLA